jgi:RND superfamily putative drug exporter
VLFSAGTVALSMSATALFPMYFLRSFAYAGVAVVAFVAVAAITVTSAAIALLGDRLASVQRPKPVAQTFFYRLATFVMRRAIPIGLPLVTLLVMLGAPFLGRQVGSRRRSGVTDIGPGAPGGR